MSRRHDFLELDQGAFMAINRPADAPPLTPDQEDAFRSIAAAAIEHVDRERVEAAGFPFPIRRCASRGFGQR